jgi:adenosylcobinamide kinase/adenosylcobinamide-phosphate guanylyltransferase
MDEKTSITFILGGARSGKSRFAETLAGKAAASQVYIATAEAHDEEMRARIARHQRDRGEGWRTVEAPLELPGAIRREAGAGRVVLVDCLTLWLSNLMAGGADIEAQTGRLIAALRAARGPVILVSNEVGLGIVPDNALARAFRDHAGRLHQAVAALAGRVVFMAAGLPLEMKPPNYPDGL